MVANLYESNPVSDPMLEIRALLLGKVETTFNTDALPTVASDAFLVENPDVKMKPNVLERDFARPSLSQLDIAIGRKIVEVTFSLDLKSSGTLGVTPKLATMLRGCGCALTTIANTAAAVIFFPAVSNANTGSPITFAKTSAPTGLYGRYLVTCVKAGASGVAKLRVTGNPPEQDFTLLPNEDFSTFVMGNQPQLTLAVNKTDPTAPIITVGGATQTGDMAVAVLGGVRFAYKVTVTDTTPTIVATNLAALIASDSRFAGTTAAAGVITVTLAGTAAGALATTGTPVTLGASTATLTPTFSGSLALGDVYVVDLLQPGIHATPVSGAFDSMTLYVFYDGVLHRVTGCRGTANFTADAGAYGKVAFTFTGSYNDPQDADLPTSGVVFEPSDPVQVELAQLTYGIYRPILKQYTFDQANSVVARDDSQSSDGYRGAIITGRKPAGGFDPEAIRESKIPYYFMFRNATRWQFSARVGTVPGNIVEFYCPNTQLDDLSYGNRNQLRTMSNKMRFAGDTPNGNDEYRIIFR